MRRIASQKNPPMAPLLGNQGVKTINRSAAVRQITGVRELSQYAPDGLMAVAVVGGVFVGQQLDFPTAQRSRSHDVCSWP